MRSCDEYQIVKLAIPLCISLVRFGSEPINWLRIKFLLESQNHKSEVNNRYSNVHASQVISSSTSSLGNMTIRRRSYNSL